MPRTVFRFVCTLSVAGALLVAPSQGAAQDAATYCGPDEAPVFSLGFAELKGYAGDPMGDPVTCEYGDPNGSGDVYQDTTTGSTVYRAATADSIFTSGNDHWAITPDGPVSWSGPDGDPPANLLALLQLPATDAAVTEAAAPVQDAPPPPKVSLYWGAYIDNVPASMTGLDAFESAVGKKVSIVHWGQSWAKPPSNPFQTDRFDRVRNRGAIPMLDWGAWQLGAGINQPDFRLATIAKGTYDGYLKQWASAAKAWGHPFFLRFGWEMNGNWQFPWSAQLNGNKPADYVAAWRHIHDIFVQQGATNATWVWCPNVVSGQTTPLPQVYPGDDYVDWTCLDGYNQGGSSSSWQSLAQIFSGKDLGGFNPKDSYGEMRTLAPNKPMMLGEVASSERGGSKAAWIRDMLQSLPTTYPQIKAVVWFDWNGGDPNLSWPVDSSADSLSAFAAGIADPTYAPNNFANTGGGKVQPPS
jgi:mannan endo-1,4-beta-mannosidase